MLIMPILTGCGTLMGISGISVVSDYCDTAQPISWSGTDSDQTILEVKAHNAVYDDKCEIT